jgi:cytoskeleton protein RodZ
MVASNGSSGKHHASDQQQSMPEVLTLGQYLRSEREKKKLTIEELRQKTGIHLTALHALEHDLRQELPADVFVRGFIKLYAKTLELDPQKALALFRNKNSSDAKGPESFVGRDLLSSESLAESPLFTRKKLLFCFSLALLGLLAFIVYRYQPLQGLRVLPLVSTQQQTSPSVKVNPPVQQPPRIETEPVPENNRQETTAPALQPTETLPPSQAASTVYGKPAGATASGSSTQIEPVPQPESVNASQGQMAPAGEDKALHTLTATFSQMTWVRTEIDHNEAKEAFFRPGTSASWQARENIEIVLGNSGGVSLVFDDTPVNLHGKEGKVLRLSFP